jgi:hypothetical protein
VFFVRKKNDPDRKDLVLKIFPKNQKKAFTVENLILGKIEKAEIQHFGFPKMVSVLEEE